MALRPWTPADLTAPLDIMAYADNAVWSGSNLASIANSGSVGGSFTLIGTPVKGPVYNGITSILFDKTKGLKIPSVPFVAGARFWFAVTMLHTSTSSDNCIVAHEWDASSGSMVVYFGNKTNVAGTVWSFWNGTTSGNNQSTGQPPQNTLLSGSGSYTTTVDLTLNGATYPDNNTGEGGAPIAKTANAYIGYSGTTYGPEGLDGDLLFASFADNIPSAADLARLQGWASWHYAGDGSMLPAGHAYKTAAPTIDDGTGGTVVSGAATMNGVGALAATGITLATRAVAMAGVGSLSATGARISAGQFTATGAGSLQASSSSVTTGAVSFSGTANMALSGKSIYSRIVSFAGSGSLSAAGRKITSSVASMVGTSAFAADSPPPPVDPAAAAIINIPLVPVDAQRTDWPRLVANAVNALIKQYKNAATNPFMQLDAAPFTPSEGQVYYDNTLHKARLYNGTSWVDL